MSAPALALPAVEPPAATRDFALEFLRGTAALGVLLAHITGFFINCPPNSLAGYVSKTGHDWVVVFFVLSGVVNALSDERRPGTAGGFLLRRLRRIVPIYLAACLLGAAVDYLTAKSPMGLNDVLGILTFTTDSQLYGFAYGPRSNPPVWSLTFEMWFYVMFALTLWNHRRGYVLWAVGGALALVALTFLPFFTAANTACSILAHSLCWLWGWTLVRFRNRWRVSPVFAGLACGLGLLVRPAIIYPANLDAARNLWLALCLGPLFLNLIGARRRESVWPTGPEWGLAGLAGLAGILILKTWSQSSRTTYLLAAASPVAGFLAAYLWTKLGDPLSDTGRFRSFSLWAGRYSYALYLAHYPLLFLAVIMSPLSGLLFLLTALPLLVWWFEDRLHPAVLRAFDRAFPRLSLARP